MDQGSDQVSRYDLNDESSFKNLSAESAGTGADQNADDTDELRAGIEQTRSEMGETIEAIQERLNPQHLKEQVKDQVREQFQEAKANVREATLGKAEEMVRYAGDTINETRNGIMETIRHNPVPAALVGIGLGWLFVNRRSGAAGSHRNYDDGRRGYTSQRGYVGGAGYYGGDASIYGEAGDQRRYGGQSTLGRVQDAAGNAVDRAQETASNAVDRAQETIGRVADQTQQTVGSAVHQAQETAGTIANQAQEAASYIADQAQYQAQRVEDRFEQALHEYPLAIGAMALAVGAAVGLSLPQTERENQLLGEARDNLVDRAQEVAQNTLEKVQQVAGEVVDQAQTTVQEQTREHGSSSQ